MTQALTNNELVDLIRRGRRAKSRGNAIVRIIAWLATQAVIALAGGFELMLAVQIAHEEWVPALPTIGYWWAVLLVFLLRGTFSATRPDSSR